MRQLEDMADIMDYYCGHQSEFVRLEDEGYRCTSCGLVLITRKELNDDHAEMEAAKRKVNSKREP